MHTGKVQRGCTSSYGGFKLYANPGPPNPASSRGIAVGRVGRGLMRAWGHPQISLGSTGN